MQEERSHVLAIDLGTSGCKCAAVSLSGRVASWAFEPVATATVGRDGAEQSPEEWWRAFRAAAGTVVSQCRHLSLEIVAACASAQSEVTVAVDGDGNPLHPALLWLDMRGRDAIRRRAGSGPFRVAGYGPWKLQRWLRVTGGVPALSGKDSAAHMLFIKEQRPAIYERTHKFLNALDYLNFRLTGRMAATPDSILTSWVTDNRNPRRVRYHDGLIRTLDLDRDKLPDLVGCAETIGPMRASVAHEIGLPAAIPVVAGSVDVSAAAVGSGAIAHGQVHLYLGTSSWLAAHVPRKKTHLFSHIAAVPCAPADRYLMIALQEAGGSNLSFLRDRVFFHQDELLRPEERPDVYRVLDGIADRVPAGSRGLVYTPWLFGERCPVDDPTVRGGLLNLSMQHTREDIIRAVLEGVALNTRWTLGPVRRFLRGYAVDEITVVGGGGASEVWCQVFADVLDLPIRQIESPIQANAIGSALIAGVALGSLAFDDAPALARTRRVYAPNPRQRGVYDDAYETFVEVYRRLAPLYRRLNREPPKDRA